MLYGIIAAEGEAGLQGPAGIQPTGSFDFVNGEYDWNGTTLAASDVTDRTDWIGASGLAVPGSQSAGAELIYADLQDRLANCNWTVVINCEILSLGGAPFRAVLLTIQNSGGAYYIEISFQNEWYVSAGDGSGYPFLWDDVHSISTGIHRLAVTRIDNSISLSVDANAVQTDSTACVLPVIGYPMVNFFLGGWSDSTTYAVNIRSLSVYDAVSDADLPSLT